jgi:hypothetical protein
MKMKGLWSSAVVIAVLLLVTAGTTLAAGKFSGSWGRAFKVEPQLAELVRGEDPVSDQILAPFGEERFGVSAAPKSKIDGCPAPCEAPVLTFAGSVSGLGNSDGTLFIEGAGYPVTCESYGGESLNAGINEAPVLLSSATSFDGVRVTKNGKAPVSGSVSVDQIPTSLSADYCPDSDGPTNVHWMEGKVLLLQDNGNVVCEVTVFEGKKQQHLFCP